MAVENLLSIGQVAKRADVSVSTLHFYEQKGLIKSQRDKGNRRCYHREVLRRVGLIKAGQSVGLTLEQLKNMLSPLPLEKAPTQQEWELLATDWQAQLSKKIDYLQTLQEYLTGCIGCGCLSMKHCPLYNPEDECAQRGNGAVLLNESAQ